LFSFLALAAFSILMLFDKSDTPTGNVILSSDVTEEDDLEKTRKQAIQVDNEVKEKTILPKPRNYIKNTGALKPNYILYQMIKEDSGSNIVSLHYSIDSDNPVEFMLFPTKKDMMHYAELKNMKYDRYYCGGFGKHIEGDCMVDDVGFSIWNSDGGISVAPDYELIFTKDGKSFEISPQRSSSAKRLLTS